MDDPRLKDFTVDVQILIYGSGLASQTERVRIPPSKRFMDRMIDHEEARLVLDLEKGIQREYDLKLGPQSHGKYWVQAMATRGKIEWVNRANLERRVAKHLREARFDSGDIPYVRACASSPSKRLVSQDDDYSPRVQRILRQGCEIKVLHDPDEAVILLC